MGNNTSSIVRKAMQPKKECEVPSPWRTNLSIDRLADWQPRTLEGVDIHAEVHVSEAKLDEHDAPW